MDNDEFERIWHESEAYFRETGLYPLGSEVARPKLADRSLCSEEQEVLPNRSRLSQLTPDEVRRLATFWCDAYYARVIDYFFFQCVSTEAVSLMDRFRAFSDHLGPEQTTLIVAEVEREWRDKLGEERWGIFVEQDHDAQRRRIEEGQGYDPTITDRPTE